MTDALITYASWYAAGLTVLHSFWQASLLALLLWGISRVGRCAAEVRYRLGFALLLLQVLLSVCTFRYVYVPVSPAEVALVVGWPVPATTVVVTAATPAPAFWALPEFWLAVLVGCWLLSMLVGGLRLFSAYVGARRVARHARPVTPTGPYAAVYGQVRSLAARLGIRGRLRLGISDAISGPMLVGHLRPILLFPAVLITHLPPDEAEAAILHELAHLQRYDHLLHPLQCFIEVLFYYHPAIHWISARVREERENCCDDTVLRYGGGRLAYARALLYFSEHARATGPAVLALTDGSRLLDRVRRFIHHQEKIYTMNARLLLLPLFALLTLAASAAYAPTEGGAEPSAELPTAPAPAAPPADTLPQGTHQVTRISNGKTTRLRVEDGSIRELELDGQVIPEEDFPEYEAQAEELLGIRTPAPRAEPTAFYFPEDSFASALRMLRFGNESLRIAGESLRNGEHSLRAGENWSFDFSPDSLRRIAFQALESVNLDSIMASVPRLDYRHFEPAEVRQHALDALGAMPPHHSSMRVDSQLIDIRTTSTLEMLEARRALLEAQLENIRQQQREIEDDWATDPTPDMRRLDSRIGRVINQLKAAGDLGDEPLRRIRIERGSLQVNGKELGRAAYNQFNKLWKAETGKSWGRGVTMELNIDR
ncbi:M56 family metallopeptidase [Lewinella sp. IMCC34183]|uniref:M56 family metallopeptidase n=1 Tax=Lewinella sp. IMCC34183 TaxID=2248762 RepID=UPI000E24AEBA|nr:M56 family metallopeptidase [Lewinella sp. IMCC34183]